MAQQEQVLVIDRHALENAGLLKQGIFPISSNVLDKVLQDLSLRFVLRAQTEQDPSKKQLIPYVILRYQDALLTYVRGKRAGETRLVGHRSIGIGGHINPTDDMSLFGNHLETYFNAVKREVFEEIDIQTSYQDQIVALLNDDSNPVGQVHLGIVHIWKLDKPAVDRKEQMITQLEFMPIQDLARLKDTMETWSQLCLDAILQGIF